MKNLAKMPGFEFGFNLSNANLNLDLPFFMLEKLKAPNFHLVLDSKEILFYEESRKNGCF